MGVGPFNGGYGPVLHQQTGTAPHAPAPTPPPVIRPPAVVRAPAPRRAAAPAPAPRRAAPAPGGGGGGAPAAPAAPAFAPEQSGTYLQQLAAIQAAMANYNTDYGNNVNQYNVQYGDAMKNLGWSAAAQGTADNPLTPNIDESKGIWNQTDQNTASGRGYQNQLNDFSGRGLLQSSYYAQALNDLFNSLNQQRGSVDTAKSNYMTKLGSDKTAFSLQNTQQVQNARDAAFARFASGITG